MYYNLNTQQFQLQKPAPITEFIMLSRCEHKDVEVLKLVDSNEALCLHDPDYGMELKAIELFKVQNPLFVNCLTFMQLEEAI